MKKLGLLVMPLIAVSLLANCNSNAKTYHIKFTNGNEIVEEKNYKENEVIIAPDNPKPYEKDHKVYTFENWYDGDFKFEKGLKATKDYNFDAKFTSEDITYTVTFKDKSEDVKTITGKFGDPIEAPTDPEGYDDNTDYYHYNFDAWYDGKTKFVKGATIVGNQTFTSKYIKGDPVIYTAIFHDDGEDKEVEFNVNDTIKETPAMTHSASTGYTAYWLIGGDRIKPGKKYDFVGYLGSTIEINYGDIINTHKITLWVGDDKYDQFDEVEYGTKILSLGIPQTEDAIDKIEGDDHYYHHFTGKWTYTQGGTDYVNKVDTLGDADMNIYAEFVKKEADPINYTIRFLDEDGETILDTKTIYCPDHLSITAPTISKEPETGYDWRWVKDTYSIDSEETVEFGDDEQKFPINDYDFVLKYVVCKYNITYELGDVAAINPPANPKTYMLTDTVTLSNPTLDGFTFKGWYLAPNESKPLGGNGWESGQMIGDITLYADWHVNNKTLANYSWSDINNISNKGEASKYFDIGEETAAISMNNYTYHTHIIGFNHDDLVNKNKAGITFEFTNLITENNEAKRVPWDINAVPDYNSTNYNFMDSKLNSFVSNIYTNLLPSDLKGVIKTVVKNVAITKNYKAEPYPTQLFPLACDEITSQEIDWANHDEGETYQYYINHPESDYRKKKIAGDAYASNYWLRTPAINGETHASIVYYDGKISASMVSNEYAVAPAFCI